MGQYISNVSAVTIGMEDDGSTAYDFGDFLIVFDENSSLFSKERDASAALAENQKTVDELFRRANMYYRARGHLYLNELCYMFNARMDMKHGNKAGWSRTIDRKGTIRAIRQVMSDGTIMLNVNAYPDISPFALYPSTVQPKVVPNSHYREEYEFEDPFFLLDNIAKAYEKMGDSPAAFTNCVGELLWQNDLLTYEVVGDGSFLGSFDGPGDVRRY